MRVPYNLETLINAGWVIEEHPSYVIVTPPETPFATMKVELSEGELVLFPDRSSVHRSIRDLLTPS